ESVWAKPTASFLLHTQKQAGSVGGLVPRQPHHLRLDRSSAISAVDGADVAACGTGILVPVTGTQAAAGGDRTNAQLAAPLAPRQGDDLPHPLPRSPNRATRSPAQPQACHDASCTIKMCVGVACTTNIGRMRSPDR